MSYSKGERNVFLKASVRVKITCLNITARVRVNVTIYFTAMVIVYAMCFTGRVRVKLTCHIALLALMLHVSYS